MTNSSDPPGNSGGSFDLSTEGFGNSQKQQFDLLINDARSNRAEAVTLYRRAASLAHEWQETDACYLAISELAETLKVQGKHEDELRALKEIAKLGANKVKQATFMINVDKRLGICYANLRKLDNAIEHLRAAVLRCQTSDSDSIDEFVDILCNLAHVYTFKNSTDRARTCIKQAYALVGDEDERIDLQAHVLEELANITYVQHRPKEAARAFIQVLKLKQQAFGPVHPEFAKTFSALGMCFLDLQNLDEAETSFVQALEYMRLINKLERGDHANSLNKLAGVYRKQGRFLEASLLEQGASEIVGRAVDQRLGFFKEFDAGLAAQQHKHYDMALNCYRRTLVALELVFEKQAFVRVPILCRMAEIAAERKQKIAYKTLIIEIEEGLSQLETRDHKSDTSSRLSDTCASLLHLARLFRFLRYDVFADSCYRFAGALQRKKPDERQALIMKEHLSLLHSMEASKESQFMQKYLRRACKVLGTSPEQSAPRLPGSVLIGKDLEDSEDIIAEIIS